MSDPVESKKSSKSRSARDSELPHGPLHAILIAATIVTIYPVLWVITIAFSGKQSLAIAEEMMGVLASPPKEGQHVGEWAKQQACRSRAFQTEVPVVAGFDAYLVQGADAKAEDREHRDQQRVTDGLAAVTEVMALGAPYWETIRAYGRMARILTPDDDTALAVACLMPRRLPSDRQAVRVIAVREKCVEAGFEEPAGSKKAQIA